jgi:hypothetical protein
VGDSASLDGHRFGARQVADELKDLCELEHRAHAFRVREQRNKALVVGHGGLVRVGGLRGPSGLVRYGDVALLASMLCDDLLSTSLRQLYLDPLKGERDGGKVARKTLRAYFSARRNVSSTAAALGVSRRTIGNRLHAIEERLGRELDSSAAELEAVLRLEELRQFS